MEEPFFGPETQEMLDAFWALNDIPNAIKIIGYCGMPDRMKVGPCLGAGPETSLIKMWWRECPSTGKPLMLAISFMWAKAKRERGYPADYFPPRVTAIHDGLVDINSFVEMPVLLNQLRTGFHAWLERRKAGDAEWAAMVAGFKPEPVEPQAVSPLVRAIGQNRPMWPGAVGGAR